jgi:hypothetical protein
MGLKDFNTWIKLNEASAKVPGRNVPDELYDAADEFNKISEFKSFIELLPTDAFKGIDLVFNKILLTPQNTREFFDKLYTMKSVKEISVRDYASGIGSILFMAEPKGLGRGELFIAWLVKDSQVSGGGESFDVQYGDEKYEVKDYSKNNTDSIRLGTKGKVTRFGFWNEIIDTVTRIDNLMGFSAGETKFDFPKYFSAEYADVCSTIMRIGDNWLGGEMGYKDFDILQRFYDMTYALENKVDKDLITNVIFRGPDARPQEISIEPISAKEIENDQIITLNKADSDRSYTYILTELRRLKYVRNPKALMEDINKEVKNIVNGLPFIVFRPDGPHIETDFKFNRISQGSIKIIETRLSKRDS